MPDARRMVEVLLRKSAIFFTEDCSPPGSLLVRSIVSCGAAMDAIRRELAARRGDVFFFFFFYVLAQFMLNSRPWAIRWPTSPIT